MKISENQLHAQIFQHLHNSIHPIAIIHHSPNGGKRSPLEGQLFKSLGTQPGFPDLLILSPHLTLLLEIKIPTGKLSPAQVAMHKKLNDLHIPVLTVYSYKEYLDTIRPTMCALKPFIPHWHASKFEALNPGI